MVTRPVTTYWKEGSAGQNSTSSIARCGNGVDPWIRLLIHYHVDNDTETGIELIEFCNVSVGILDFGLEFYNGDGWEGFFEMKVIKHKMNPYES